MLYQILDILVTISEASLYYVMAYCFRLIPENKVRKYLPYVIWILIVYAFTWGKVNIEAYKLAVVTLCMALLLCIYRVSIFSAAITAMFGSTLTILTESVGTVVSSFIISTASVMVNGQEMLPWSFCLTML